MLCNWSLKTIYLNQRSWLFTIGAHALKLTTAVFLSTSSILTGTSLCRRTNSIGAGISIDNMYEASSLDKIIWNINRIIKISKQNSNYAYRIVDRQHWNGRNTIRHTLCRYLISFSFSGHFVFQIFNFIAIIICFFFFKLTVITYK